MPLYEYSCEDCGKTFEHLVSARKRDDGVECPECGSENTTRLISSFAIGKAGGSTGMSCPTGTCNLGL